MNKRKIVLGALWVLMVSLIAGCGARVTTPRLTGNCRIDYNAYQDYWQQHCNAKSRWGSVAQDMTCTNTWFTENMQQLTDCMRAKYYEDPEDQERRKWQVCAAGQSCNFD